jgi:hypothetical protein
MSDNSSENIYAGIKSEYEFDDLISEDGWIGIRYDLETEELHISGLRHVFLRDKYDTRHKTAIACEEFHMNISDKEFLEFYKNLGEIKKQIENKVEW